MENNQARTATVLYANLRRMRWRQLKYDFPAQEVQSSCLPLLESIWQFDDNKIAYVLLNTQVPIIHAEDNIDKRGLFEAHQARICLVAKTINSEGNKKIMLVLFTEKISILEFVMLEFDDIANIDQFISLSPFELQVLTNNWKFDQLTLWKYAKYYRMAEQTIQFSPYNTHLSIYEWYQRNNGSFFDSDKAPFNVISFDFIIEGDNKRKGIGKLDKIGIPFWMNNAHGYMHCIRKEEHYPVYISMEIMEGWLRNCLLKYRCPIWLTASRRGDRKADVYMNAILYWLHELYADLHSFIGQFGKQPIHFVLHLDEKLYAAKDIDTIVSNEVAIKYEIKAAERRIDFILPSSILQELSMADNEGERKLMLFIVKLFNELIGELKLGEKLSDEEQNSAIDRAIPLGNKKMIIIATDDFNIKLSEVDTQPARTIPDEDVSFILERQMFDLNLPYKLPGNITEIPDKIKILNALVSLHFKTVTEKLQEYDFNEILVFLMYKHESLIQKRVFNKLNYAAQHLCYGQYYDVFEKFSQKENKSVETTLALRTLIEFVACVLPTGNKVPNDDDIDQLLAHTIQLIKYGSISDSIRFGIENHKIGLLPSGRLGLANGIQSRNKTNFSLFMRGEEFDSFKKGFKSHFRQRVNSKRVTTIDEYDAKINRIFKEEWGVQLWNLMPFCLVICSSLFEAGKSIKLMKATELISLLTDSTTIDPNEIVPFLTLFRFKERKSILIPPTG